MPRKAYDTVAQQRFRLWKDAWGAAQDGASDSVAQQRLAKLAIWAKDPWAYLTGTDVATECSSECNGPVHIEVIEGTRYEWTAQPGFHARPIIWTTDERDDVHAIKAFPTDRPHLYHVHSQLWQYQILAVEKARQMIVSTLAMAEADWYASFVLEREIVVSKLTEAQSIKLINDKIRTTHARKPKWLQEAIPQTTKPMDIITYPKTGSTITAVANTFGSGSARGITASLVVADEAAYQPMLPDIFRAVLPMAVRLWLISSANIGNPGADLMAEICTEGKPTRDVEEAYGSPDPTRESN